MRAWLVQLVIPAVVLGWVSWRSWQGIPAGTLVSWATWGAVLHAVVIVGVVATRRGRSAIHSHRRHLVLAAVSVAFTYGFIEVLTSGLGRIGVLTPVSQRGSHFYYENSSETIRFDSIRGYRLTSTPCRWARVTNGVVEYVGTIRGNNGGFPDRDDFWPERGQDAAPRIAVFGDSFTAAQFIEVNWPDRVEELARKSQQPIHLLNFSVDGGGLLNWWSILAGVLESERYEIDGAVFAVYVDDLRRGFAIADHRGTSRFGYVFCDGQRPLPATIEEAMPLLNPSARTVDAAAFEAAIGGRARWEFFFSTLLLQTVRDLMFPRRDYPQSSELPVAKIAEMRAYFDRHGIPVMVVAIPSRSLLVKDSQNPEVAEDIKTFSSLMGGELENGGLAFQGRNEKEVCADWFPYDAHWNQLGSDRFAGYIVDRLRAWLQRNRK